MTKSEGCSLPATPPRRASEVVLEICMHDALLPPAADVLDAFDKEMEGRIYGPMKTWEAFLWFRDGWLAQFARSESAAIVALRAELEQERDIRSTREITLSLVADGLGVEHEPHQTFDERLLEASWAPPLRTAWLIECPKHPLAYYQSGPRLGIDLVDGEFIKDPWQADQFTAKDGADMFIKALRTNPRFREYEMTAVLHEFGVQKGGG